MYSIGMKTTRKVVITTAILLASVAVLGTNQQQVKACGLDDLGSCFNLNEVQVQGQGQISDGYYAGQQDAQYDHAKGNPYNPIAACCHPDYWNSQFHQGYDTQWNTYQSQNTEQKTSVNIYGNDNYVNVGQTNHQRQDQSQGPSPATPVVGCGDNGPCSGGNGPSPEPCGYNNCGGVGPGPEPYDYGYHHYFHHFWHEGCGFDCHHYDGFGYRHVGFGSGDE